MTDIMNKATRAAGAALEAAINSAESVEEQMRIAEMFVVLGSNFLRAVFGEDYTRQFLQNGIDNLDHPAVMNVIRVSESNTQH